LHQRTASPRALRQGERAMEPPGALFFFSAVAM